MKPKGFSQIISGIMPIYGDSENISYINADNSHINTNIPHVRTNIPYISFNNPYISLNNSYIRANTSHISTNNPHISVNISYVGGVISIDSTFLSYLYLYFTEKRIIILTINFSFKILMKLRK
jgi:hypothetical protein